MHDTHSKREGSYGIFQDVIENIILKPLKYKKKLRPPAVVSHFLYNFFFVPFHTINQTQRNEIHPYLHQCTPWPIPVWRYIYFYV